YGVQGAGVSGVVAEPAAAVRRGHAGAGVPAPPAVYPRHARSLIMEWQMALILMLGSLFLLMAIGTPVVFAFLSVNLLGAWLFLGEAAGLAQWARNTTASIGSFSLTPIPLFVLMGEVLFHTGLAFKAIDSIERMISRVPGKL